MTMKPGDGPWFDRLRRPKPASFTLDWVGKRSPSSFNHAGEIEPRPSFHKRMPFAFHTLLEEVPPRTMPSGYVFGRPGRGFTKPEIPSRETRMRIPG